MDGLGPIVVGPDPLPGPAGPCHALMLHLFGKHTQKLQAHDSISLIIYHYASQVPYAQTNQQGRIHL